MERNCQNLYWKLLTFRKPGQPELYTSSDLSKEYLHLMMDLAECDGCPQLQQIKGEIEICLGKDCSERIMNMTLDQEELKARQQLALVSPDSPELDEPSKSFVCDQKARQYAFTFVLQSKTALRESLTWKNRFLYQLWVTRHALANLLATGN